MERGLICSDAINDPMPCSDYQVRYYCECPGKSTYFMPRFISRFLICFNTIPTMGKKVKPVLFA